MLHCYMCTLHTCDAWYSRISVSVSGFSLLGPGVGASGLCLGPGAPSVTSPAQARKSPVARPGEQRRVGPAKQMWAGTWDFNCFLTFKRDGEEARRMWNGDNGMIFYPTQLSNTVWGDHSYLVTCIVPLVRCMMIAFGARIQRLICGMARLGLLPPDRCGPSFAPPLAPPSPPSVRFSSMYWAKYRSSVNFSCSEAGTWPEDMVVRLLPSPNWTNLKAAIMLACWKIFWINMKCYLLSAE